MESKVRTVCAANCGGRSLLDCTVRDGVLVSVEPAPHPDPRYEGLCVRCLTLPQWVYGADRIRTPLRRTSARGTAAEFSPISWDEALDEIASRIRSVQAHHGPASVAFTRTSGASPNGNYVALADLLGATNLFGGVDMAVHMGLNQALGYKGMFGQHCNEWTDRVNSKLIVVWGSNVAETSMTSFRFLLDARDAGAEIVVIDPRYSATAMHATWWIAPRPGTDLALALGMLHVIIDEGLVERDFALRHSCAPLLVDSGGDGRFVRDAQGAHVHAGSLSTPPGAPGITVFDVLSEHVRRYTPPTVERITGVPANDVRELARRYAARTPAMIAFGYGVDRYMYSDMVTRAGAALAALTGNIGRAGAGVGVHSHGRGDREASLAPVCAVRDPTPGAVAVPMARAIDHGTDPRRPIRSLFIQGDWVNQRMADMNRVRAFVEGLDFVVVVDHVWQTSCELADIVLPASTFLEGDEWVRDVAIAGNSVMLRQRVIAPVHQSRPDSIIERDLAARLGFADCYTRSTEEVVRLQIETSRDPLLAGMTLDELRAAGGAVRLPTGETPHVQYRDLRFDTPSGTIEFYAESLAPFGQALPDYPDDNEANERHPLAGRYPLVLTQSHVRQRAHSTFAGVSWFLELWPEPVGELNPDDAGARGIRQGDLVEVSNLRGAVVVRAVLNPDYPPGHCNISEGWKQRQYHHGNVQVLTNPGLNEAQEFAWGHANIPFFDTRVEVRRVAP